jgi:hypothetical protein
MTEQEFINKWDDPRIGDWCNKDADCLFWARSYYNEQLLEMSKDFLSIPREKRHFSSSMTLARQTLQNTEF